jgi:signal transduction histidine kinase
MDNDDPKAMRNALEIILRAGDTATTVLKRFRKLNNAIEAQPEFKQVDVRQIYEEALELMEFRFRRHLVEVDRSELQSVKAEVNRNALIQVLVNLFINGMHAMPEGGKLHLGARIEEDNAVFWVRDTGSGIPEDILPRVIEPLFTTKGNEGSGLGLAICKEIVEIEHNGEFKIENHPQKGVVVTMSVPLKKEEENG